MELYHFTSRENLKSILEVGLKRGNEYKLEDTKRINHVLVSLSPLVSKIREDSVFLYSVEDYGYDIGLSVSLKDLNTASLYVANWEYVQAIFDLSRHNNPKVNLYVQEYINSFKLFEDESDLFRYDRAELMYYDDISPDKLRIVELEGEE